jgi:Aldo/keto reductase family
MTFVMNATPEEAARRVAEAIDAGINYFDVAPSYGNAEDRLGPALKPYRQNAFLACKTTERSKAGAAAELERSLRKMKIEYFDLYQLHAVTKMEEVEKSSLLTEPWRLSWKPGNQVGRVFSVFPPIPWRQQWPWWIALTSTRFSFRSTSPRGMQATLDLRFWPKPKTRKWVSWY